MKRKRRLIAIFVIIVFMIIGIIVISSKLKSKENGNLANMGLACENQGVVYYNKYEKGIFAIKNGKETQLTEQTAYSLNVMDDKIYFITVADFNHVVIKCVDKTGENLKNIATIYTAISKIYVDKQNIYYSTNQTGKGIVKIDLNGENEKVLVTENVQDFQVVKDDIYYVTQKSQICKTDKEANQVSQLSDVETAEKIQVVDSWIYYYDQKENALFRIKPNGKKKELVSVLIHNETYNVSGKYVYYLDTQKAKITKMRIGKSNQCTDIATLRVSKTKINVVQNIIYYLDKSQDESQTYQMYRIKETGEKVENIKY